jgi:hypothetical protein
MSFNKFFIAVWLILLSATAFSQKFEKFTRTEVECAEQLYDLFESARQGKGKEIIEGQFNPVWLQSSLFTQNQREQVYNVLDALLKNKNKVFPDFHEYIKALIAFTTSGKTEADFLTWSDVLLRVMNDKKNKKFTSEIIECSGLLFRDRSFFQNETIQWQSGSGDFRFEFDSVPAIVFGNMDLRCYSKGDSSLIYGTSGAYFPGSQRFVGKLGKVTWQRAGFDPTKTYAELSNYFIRVKSSTYSADSVTFHTEFFQQALQGRLTDKILADKTTENATYPKFESYFKRLQIQNIDKNMDYEGGFTMAGNQLIGSGAPGEPATLTIYRDNKKFFTAKSLEFAIRPERINTQHARIMFLIAEDSITHPDLSFSFDRKSRKLELLRSDEGVSMAAFQNTYHNVDMYFESLVWNLDEPTIKMGSWEGSTQRYAAFESNTYFKKKRYDSMMGLSFSHPLYELKEYATYIKSDRFTANELARYHKYSEEQVHQVLIDLNNKGFINYDILAHEIEVKPKLYWYIENNIGKRDYDVIQFSTEVESGSNAQLSLLNYDLMLKGVDNFQLSDSQQVNIQPLNQEVVLKKNRDFIFGGRVNAGNFEFNGPEYFFSYEKFQLDLLQVDSCRIYVEDETQGRNEYGQMQKTRVKSVIRDVQGYLKIDAPTNKGGYHSRTYPQYPIFTCTKTSFVYWSDPAIQKGVYKKEKFFYQLQPFTIDSLDNFSKKDLKFEGTLVSGGIFPDITEPLVLMADNSLGFTRKTGTDLPSYGGKAKVTAELKLDYSGLKGGGDFSYLTASASSKEFTFLPDSMLGQTYKFNNRELSGKVEVPKAHSDSTFLSFHAKRDNLDITSIGKPIQFFNDEATLTGTLHLKPTGMTGMGFMEFSGAKLTSDLMKYSRRKILSDTSSFQMRGVGEDIGNGLAFKTDNVNADVDFDRRDGIFKSNGGETKIEFPTNQYVCYMDQFTWYMDRDELDLSSNRKPLGDDLLIDTSEDSKSSNFYSIAEGQDSLNFLSPKAKFDLRKGKLYCQKIKYIIVADSKVTPDSGKVTIERFANMLPLTRSQILSNYVTQYHKIYNADIKIKGRRSYNAAGDITYVDEQKKEQVIHLDDIQVDTSYQTIGKGKIEEGSQFFLSPAFEYYGKFELHANNRYLIFDGGARILHNCDLMPATYFKFNSEINPDDIFIPVDSSLRDMTMTKLGVGVMITGDSPMTVYPAFLSDIREKDDRSIIQAEGFLTHDKATGRYLIGPKEKIKQPKLPGNLLALNTSNCEMNGDGRMDFNVDYGVMKFTNVGEVYYRTKEDAISTSGVAMLNFPIDEGSLKYIHEQIEKWPTLQPVDITRTKYEKSLIEILGTEKSDKLISELGLSGQMKRIPDELLATFYLADVKFKWNPIDETFQSQGQIGIASMDKKQLFKYVKGKIEIEKKRGADVLRMYIELDPSVWYYFEYKLGIMNILSSDKELGAKMGEIKDDKRRFDEGRYKYSYLFINNKKKRDDFVARFSDL